MFHEILLNGAKGKLTKEEILLQLLETPNDEEYTEQLEKQLITAISALTDLYETFKIPDVPLTSDKFLAKLCANLLTELLNPTDPSISRTVRVTLQCINQMPAHFPKYRPAMPIPPSCGFPG